MTSLSLYGSNVASSTLSTAAQMAKATGGSATGASTKAGTANGWGECYSLGNTAAWPSASSIGSPSGHGWLYDSTSLEGQQFASGTWTITFKVKSNNTNNMTAAPTARVYVRSSAGTYTLIGSISPAGQSFSSNNQVTFTGTFSGAATTLHTGDKIYVDLWMNITAANSAAGTAILPQVSSSASQGVANDLEVDTPGYSPAAASPTLSTSPTTLTFNASVGGSNPASQTSTLSETAGVGTAWTSSISYSSGSGWLALSPTSGTLTASGSATLTLSCTTGALAAGTYSATLTLTATTGGSTATVSVSFVVGASGATLSVSAPSLSFSATAGGSNPASQSDTLTNTGGVSSAWTSSISYGSGSGWLSVSPSSGTLASLANVSLTVSCTTGALTNGTYTATITLTATTGGSTATIGVTFSVGGSALTYSDYKNTLEPNLVAALSANGLLQVVQLLGPDTTMANDNWVTSASSDLKSTLSGYVRHGFPSGVTDISNDSRETTVAALMATIATNDPSGKPVFQGEMGDGSLGPGQQVAGYQYGVSMADYAVQLLRAGIAAPIAYLLDDDMHGTMWGMWQSTQDTGVPRPWFFVWSLLCQTLVEGSHLYAPPQPATNDVRLLAASSPQGNWTFVLVNRKAVSLQVQVSVSFAPVVATTLQSYIYSSAVPLLVDGNGFPLPAGTVSAVLSRGFSVTMAANSVLILTQQTGAITSVYDVKQPPLQKRR